VCDHYVFYSIGWHSPLAQQPVAGQVLPPLVSGENNFCPIIFSQYPLVFVFLYWNSWVQRFTTKLISRHSLCIKWRMSYWHPLLPLFSSTSRNLYLHVSVSVLFQFLIPFIMFEWTSAVEFHFQSSWRTVNFCFISQLLFPLIGTSAYVHLFQITWEEKMSDKRHRSSEVTILFRLHILCLVIRAWNFC
jgi:hypothetical protein